MFVELTSRLNACSTTFTFRFCSPSLICLKDLNNKHNTTCGVNAWGTRGSGSFQLYPSAVELPGPLTPKTQRLSPVEETETGRWICSPGSRPYQTDVCPCSKYLCSQGLGFLRRFTQAPSALTSDTRWHSCNSNAERLADIGCQASSVP